MQSQTEKIQELESFLLDREDEDFAKELHELLAASVEKLHNMFVQMKGQKCMKAEISFNLKHDIKGWVEAHPHFTPRCERPPFINS